MGFIRYYYQRAENPDNMKKKNSNIDIGRTADRLFLPRTKRQRAARSRRMADQPGKKRNQSPLNPASGSDRVNPLTGFQISISLKFPALICIADNDGTRNIPGLVL